MSGGEENSSSPLHYVRGACAEEHSSVRCLGAGDSGEFLEGLSERVSFGRE